METDGRKCKTEEKAEENEGYFAVRSLELIYRVTQWQTTRSTSPWRISDNGMEDQEWSSMSPLRL